ncbi:hypothetical protein [Prochlorococcus sp. MIT 1223]|uniref:hypothetical protein n=1 Tax=Prochlorococcus sp. MIT 1223 TaxID=3096217 RepID=UPI002A7669FE|nr:hypothetical protein [Prochlorococcus sp. MIT 1223]
MSQQIKCIRCGAPIQWTTSQAKCEFCGQPIVRTRQSLRDVRNVLDQINNGFRQVPLPSKKKLLAQGKILFEKQNILSDKQLKVVGKFVGKVFRRKRNIFLFMAIPISVWGYFKINYPQTAKPYYPDFPYKMPSPEETGDFVLYGREDTKEGIASLRFWCPRWRKNQSLSKCIEENSQKKRWVDIGSKKKYNDWFVVKLASSIRDGQTPSTLNHNDAAVQCKKGLIAYYQNGGLDKFYEMQSQFPSQFGYEEKEQYERRKPLSVQRKMGKLWWSSGDVDSDLESGKYLAWHRNNLSNYEERLREVSDKNYCPFREGFKHKCKNPKHRLESINTIKSLLKSSKESLALRKLWRKEHAVNYEVLLRKVCKS